MQTTLNMQNISDIRSYKNKQQHALRGVTFNDRYSSKINIYLIRRNIQTGKTKAFPTQYSKYNIFLIRMTSGVELIMSFVCPSVHLNAEISKTIKPIKRMRILEILAQLKFILTGCHTHFYKRS